MKQRFGLLHILGITCITATLLLGSEPDTTHAHDTLTDEEIAILKHKEVAEQQARDLNTAGTTAQKKALLRANNPRYKQQRAQAEKADSLAALKKPSKTSSKKSKEKKSNNHK